MFYLSNALLCNKVIRDAKTNTISIIDIVENIYLDSDPQNEPVILKSDFDLFTLWARAEQDTPVESCFRITYQLSDGEKNQLKEVPINLSKHFFYRAIIHINSIKIHGPGLYHFSIETKDELNDWKVIKEIPFLVFYNEEKDRKG